MTRFLSVLGLVLLVASSFGLYRLKYEVQRLDRQADALERANHTERQTIQVLQAEWTYLNQPQRIQELSDRFLHLKPVEPSQIARIEDIPLRGAHPAPGPRVALRPVARPGRATATLTAARAPAPSLEDDQ